MDTRAADLDSNPASEAAQATGLYTPPTRKAVIKFWSENCPAVVRLAKKFQTTGHPLDDLLQHAAVGYLNAHEPGRIKPDRGERAARNYEESWIKKSIKEGLSKEGTKVVQPPEWLYRFKEPIHSAFWKFVNDRERYPTIAELLVELGDAPFSKPKREVPAPDRAFLVSTVLFWFPVGETATPVISLDAPITIGDDGDQGALLDTHAGPYWEEKAAAERMTASLDTQLARLSTTEIEILARRYLSGDEEVGFKELAREFGISASKAHRLVQSALEKAQAPPRAPSLYRRAITSPYNVWSWWPLYQERRGVYQTTRPERPLRPETIAFREEFLAKLGPPEASAKGRLGTWTGVYPLVEDYGDVPDWPSADGTPRFRLSPAAYNHIARWVKPDELTWDGGSVPAEKAPAQKKKATREAPLTAAPLTCNRCGRSVKTAPRAGSVLCSKCRAPRDEEVFWPGVGLNRRAPDLAVTTAVIEEAAGAAKKARSQKQLDRVNYRPLVHTTPAEPMAEENVADQLAEVRAFLSRDNAESNS